MVLHWLDIVEQLDGIAMMIDEFSHGQMRLAAMRAFKVGHLHDGDSIRGPKMLNILWNRWDGFQ